MNERDKTYEERSAIESARTVNHAVIVQEDIARVSSNLNNLTGSFHALVMQASILKSNNEELKKTLEEAEEEIKDLTLQLKMIGNEPTEVEPTTSQEYKPTLKKRI